MSDIIDRLNEACKGYPAAWPHRLLHDAISEIERLRGVAQAAPNLGTVGVENLADWFYNEGHEFVISDEEEVARALLDQFDITPRKSLSVSSTPSDSAQAPVMPVKLTGELACIIECCDPPEKQTDEAVERLIFDYQPMWDRLRSALSSTSLCAPPSGLGDGDDR